MKTVKALALLSGGLDSTLTLKLALDLGVKVEAVNFVSPFCLCRKGGCGAYDVAKNFDVPLKTVNVGTEYLRVVRRPKFGYGKNMNPCIDCRIFMLKKAKQIARKTGASFILTGEVLNQRPMSQHREALYLIEREAGLEGGILRPLSARLLRETAAEQKGLIDRDRLLSIKGKSRKKQIELAEKLSVKDYACPSGGCLLTYREFAKKLRDLFGHKKRVSLKDMQMLKVGRHFRFGKNKIVVGRNENENKILGQMRAKNDYCFEVQGCGSPITILQGPKAGKAVEKAAGLTAFYSDQKVGKVHVAFGKESLNRSLTVLVPGKEDVERLRI